MPLAAWQATIVDESGDVQAGASIEVRRESTGALAAIYSDRDGNTPLSNPFNADSSGFARFHVSGGAFRITATKGGFSRTWRYVAIGLAGEYDNLPSTRVRYNQTQAELSAGLTPVNFWYEPFDLFRYMSEAQINDVTSGSALVDVTDVIQDVIDAAAALPAAQPVRFRAGKYRVTGLTLDDNSGIYNLVGDDHAVLYHVGTGACVHIGNDSSVGVLPAQIRNITVMRDDAAEDTIGFLIEHAAYSCLEGIQVYGFEVGVFVKGSIGVLLDFKRRFISGSTYGVLTESSQGSGGGLRFTCNLLKLMNAYIAGGTVNGVVIREGSGVSPSGSGGVMTIDGCVFESIDSSGRAISITNAGEINTLEEVVIRSCWFEFYGATLATITSSSARFENCFIANGSTRCFEITDDNSRLTLEGCFAYFVDAAPSVGHLVDFTGSATAAARRNIGIHRGAIASLNKLHSGYPDTDQGINIRQPSTYYAQYNGQNHGTVIDLFDEVDKFVGSGWRYCDIVFLGNDGTSDLGRVSLRLYKSGNGYSVIDLDGNDAGYTLANTGASNATITFNNDGTGRWTNMVGMFTPVL